MAESSTSDDDVPVIKKTHKSQNSISEANGVKVVYGGSKDPDDPSSDDEHMHARISKAPPLSLKTSRRGDATDHHTARIISTSGVNGSSRLQSASKGRRHDSESSNDSDDDALTARRNPKDASGTIGSAAKKRNQVSASEDESSHEDDVRAMFLQKHGITAQDVEQHRFAIAQHHEKLTRGDSAQLVKEEASINSSDCIITSIKQYHELENKKAAVFQQQETWEVPVCSSDWLQVQGLAASGLSLDDLLSHPETLDSHEQTLYAALNVYIQRLAWLDAGSRRYFGVVTEPKVSIVVDVTHGHVKELKKALEILIEEQLLLRRKFNFIKYSHKAHASPVFTSKYDDIDAAIAWVHVMKRSAVVETSDSVTKKSNTKVVTAIASTNLSSKSGKPLSKSNVADSADDEVEVGGDLLSAIKAGVDSKMPAMYLVVGQKPRYDFKHIGSELRDVLAGSDVVINIVSFYIADEDLNEDLSNLAHSTGGRFHLYDGQSCFGNQAADGNAGDDVELISDEILKLRKALETVTQQRAELEQKRKMAMDPRNMIHFTPKGTPNTAPTRTQMLQNADKKKANQWEDAQSELQRLLRMEQQERPLVPFDEPPKFLTSQEWLKENGLKPRNLVIYDVIAPLAYNAHQPGLHVGHHYQSLTKVPWHDGTVKNVHVDPGMLIVYRKRLLKILKVFSERIRWLGTGSRRLFGSLIESAVTLVIDTSFAMAVNLLLVKNHLHTLLLEQVQYKSHFNVVCFSRTAEKWSRVMVEVNERTINAAWTWIQSLHCDKESGRNIMAALKTAADSDLPRNIDHGIYIVTSGPPDQHTGGIVQFARELFVDGKTSINTCAYNCISSTVTLNLAKELAVLSNGRAHVCLEKGTWDDENHADSVSWSLLEEPLHAPSEHNPAWEKIKKQFVPVARPTSVQNSRRSTYDIVSAWLHSATDNDDPLIADSVDELAMPACVCDSQDIAILRAELKQGQHYLQVLDDILASLPPSYASAAIAVSLGKRVAEAKGITKNVVQLKKIDEKPKAQPTKSASVIIPRQTTASIAKAKTVEKQIKSQPKPVPLPKARVRVDVSPITVPDFEDNISSRSWIKKYGLKKQRLDLDTFVKEFGCAHVPSSVPITGGKVEAQYCDIYEASIAKDATRSTDKKTGSYHHVTIRPREWSEYIQKLSASLDRLYRRAAWLTDASRRVFGVVAEKNVTILIDTSGSMMPSLSFLQKQLGMMIHEQILQNCDKFNLIQFSSTVTPWAEYMVEVSADTCGAGASWCQTLECNGGTNLLPAIHLALSDESLDAIYIISDGMPDDSTQFVLREVDRLMAGRTVKIHTISFNCESTSAIEFLQSLAKAHNGRFHYFERQPRSTDLPYYYDFKSGMLLDNFADDIAGTVESDDLEALQNEIRLGEMFLDRARELHALTVTSRTSLKDDDASSVSASSVQWNESVQSRRRAQMAPQRQVASSIMRERPPVPTWSKPTKGSQLRAAYTSIANQHRRESFTSTDDMPEVWDVDTEVPTMRVVSKHAPVKSLAEGLTTQPLEIYGRSQQIPVSARLRPQSTSRAGNYAVSATGLVGAQPM